MNMMAARRQVGIAMFGKGRWMMVSRGVGGVGGWFRRDRTRRGRGENINNEGELCKVVNERIWKRGTLISGRELDQVMGRPYAQPFRTSTKVVQHWQAKC